MQGHLRLCCLLALVLLLHPPALAGSRPSQPKGSLVTPFALSPGTYENFPVDSYARTTIVQYSLSSNAKVSVAFMTNQQFKGFVNGSSEISKAIASINDTYVSVTLHLAPGSYQLLVYAYKDAANVTLSLVEYPNNPFDEGYLSPPEPTGIASFGLTNESGLDYPYEVSSTDVIGVADVTAMKAYNASAASVGADPSGLTLQLNAELVVSETKGPGQVYWCQNTPDFVTAADRVAMADNLWNFSTTGFLSNQSVTSEGGGGSVYTFQQAGETQYYYSYEGRNSTYSLPLQMVLLINATAEPGTGVLVQFGARTSSSEGQLRSVWFDNATIHDPAVQSAYFLTSGNDTTPNGSFYDTELVFGGEANGEETRFTQMNSSLGLFYANGTSPTMNTFPSYFSFGLETDESADNLRVAYIGNGEATLSIGKPNYEYLGTASGSFSLSSVEKALGEAGRETNTTTSTSSVSTTSFSFTTPAVGSSSIPEFPSQTLVACMSAVALVASYLWFRRSKALARA